MPKMTGGQALAKSLYREGVRVIFGLPGVQLYHLLDGLYDEPGITFITTRHEQATSYMADGYARAGGGIGPAPACKMPLQALAPPTLPRRRSWLFQDKLSVISLVLAGNWLQVFRRADAALLGSDRRQPHQTRAVREEKCVGLRASV